MPKILERELPTIIKDWLAPVEKESDLACIPLTFEERTGHLQQLLHDVTRTLPGNLTNAILPQRYGAVLTRSAGYI